MRKKSYFCKASAGTIEISDGGPDCGDQQETIIKLREGQFPCGDVYKTQDEIGIKISGTFEIKELTDALLDFDRGGPWVMDSNELPGNKDN
jgi:hypothetical protein